MCKITEKAKLLKNKIETQKLQDKKAETTKP